MVRYAVEPLEDRVVPAAAGTAVAYPILASTATHDFSAAGDGYTPAQIRNAYGINGIAFGTVAGNGAGQTIAIVDAFNDPNLVTDLDAFDQQFTLTGSGPTIYQQYGAASSFLTLVNQTGGSILPAADPTGGWEQEETLDIEWAHAIAPAAKIVLVEANSDQTMNDLFTAVRTAASLPGVSVVSMSWGFTEFAGEQSNDSAFTTPAGHQGVTFLAATGDYGTSSYPPYSPNVVAVGGTSLSLDASGSYLGETGWGVGGRTAHDGGSGGGVSGYEPQPSYQYSVQNTGSRTNPDVAMVGDPNTGVPVYDSFNDGSSGPWAEEGGTSLATPMWAALVAIANQGRVAGGSPTLDGRSQTLPALYSLPAADFHDVTSGSNGAYSATAGYDLVTGRGTPVANLLVPALASYGVADHLVVTIEPPASVAAGSPFSLQVVAERPSGQVDTSYFGQMTLSLANNPGGGALGGTVSVQASGGIARFTGVTISAPGNGYTIQITSNGLSAGTSAINVLHAAATHLVITAEPPSSTDAGAAFSVKVAAEDASGAVVPSYSGVISLSLASNPGNATLGGTVTLSAVNGTAVFDTLTVNQAGSGYTITASGGGLLTATSTAFNVLADPGAPGAPQLAPQSQTGVSATYTRDSGSIGAPLVFTVSGVSPANGYVFLYDVTNPSAPVPLGDPTQAVGGVATVTLAGTPLSSGLHLIAAASAATANGTPSARSAPTSVYVDTSLSVTNFSPSANFLTSLPNNQVLVTFSAPLAGMTPDLANGQGIGPNPFAVMLIPSGPDGPASQAATGNLWAAPSGVDRGDLPVPATLVYHLNPNGTSTIALTPNQPLASDIYLISVSGTVTDVAGNTLGSSVFFSFAYHAPVTISAALQVSGVTANNGTTVLSNNAIPQPDTIGIAFNKPLDSRTVNSSTVQLYASNGFGQGTLVPTGVAYSPTTGTVYLTPEAILFPGTVYYISVASSVRDASNYPNPGQALGYTFTTSFTVSQPAVGAGSGTLRVTATSPAGGTQWNGPFGYGAVSFNESINQQSLGRFSAMLIPHTGGVTTGTSGYADVPLNAKVAFNPNTNQLIIVPTGALPNDTIFAFALSGITATNGSTLSGTTYSTFLWDQLPAIPAVVKASSASAAPAFVGASQAVAATTSAQYSETHVARERSAATRASAVVWIRPRLRVPSTLPTVPRGPSGMMFVA